MKIIKIFFRFLFIKSLYIEFISKERLDLITITACILDSSNCGWQFIDINVWNLFLFFFIELEIEFLYLFSLNNFSSFIIDDNIFPEVGLTFLVSKKTVTITVF